MCQMSLSSEKKKLRLTSFVKEWLAGDYHFSLSPKKQIFSSLSLRALILLSVLTNRESQKVIWPLYSSFQGPTSDSGCFHIMNKMKKTAMSYDKVHESIMEYWEWLPSLIEKAHSLHN